MSNEIFINIECKKKLNDSNSGVFQQRVFEDEILSKTKEIISFLETLEKYTFVVQHDKQPSVIEGLMIYNRLFNFF